MHLKEWKHFIISYFTVFLCFEGGYFFLLKVCFILVKGILILHWNKVLKSIYFKEIIYKCKTILSSLYLSIDSFESVIFFISKEKRKTNRQTILDFMGTFVIRIQISTDWVLPTSMIFIVCVSREDGFMHYRSYERGM